MTERTREDTEPTEEAPLEELAGPARLPSGLRTDWPVPRLAVRGPREGLAATIEYRAMRAVIALSASLPSPLRRASVAALAALAARLDRRHSEAARTFLRQALGPGLSPRELDARVRAAWRHLFDVVLDSEGFDRHVLGPRIKEHFELVLDDDVRALISSKRGTILVTAHVGDWEAAAAVMPWLGFDPFYAISKPPRSRPVSEHLQRMREQRGIRVLPRRGAMRYAARVIESGGTLAMLLDQRARVKPVMAPFFGRPARCDRGAGVLIKRLHAPVLFAVCYRTERRWQYRLELGPVWEPTSIAREKPEEIARRINVELERMILRAPEQYLWLHDRYRGAPEAAI